METGANMVPGPLVTVPGPVGFSEHANNGYRREHGFQVAGRRSPRRSLFALMITLAG